jgi:hypothetical protein
MGLTEERIAFLQELYNIALELGALSEICPELANLSAELGPGEPFDIARRQHVTDADLNLRNLLLVFVFNVNPTIEVVFLNDAITHQRVVPGENSIRKVNINVIVFQDAAQDFLTWIAGASASLIGQYRVRDANATVDLLRFNAFRSEGANPEDVVIKVETKDGRVAFHGLLPDQLGMAHGHRREQ